MHIPQWARLVDDSGASVCYCIGLGTTPLKLLSRAPTPKPATGAATSPLLHRRSRAASGAITDVTCLVGIHCVVQVAATALRKFATRLLSAPMMVSCGMPRQTLHTSSNFAIPMRARTKCTRRTSRINTQVFSHARAYSIFRLTYAHRCFVNTTYFRRRLLCALSFLRRYQQLNSVVGITIKSPLSGCDYRCEGVLAPDASIPVRPHLGYHA